MTIRIQEENERTWKALVCEEEIAKDQRQRRQQ
jgi:hypothetical protein